MRKFKHIKTGYIATPIETITDIYKYDCGEAVEFFIHLSLLENSKDWEELKESSYKILSFTGFMTPTEYNYFKSTNFRMMDKIKSINSIERLSDGEIFSIGDWFKCGGCGGRIDKFNIIWGEVFIGDCKFPLNDIKK